MKKKSTEKSQQEHRMKGKEYWQPKSIVRSPFCLFIRFATMQQPQRPSFRDLGVMRLHVNAGYFRPRLGGLSPSFPAYCQQQHQQIGMLLNTQKTLLYPLSRLKTWLRP